MIYRSKNIIALTTQLKNLYSNRCIIRNKSDSSNVDEFGRQPGKWSTGSKVNSTALHPETLAILNQQVNAEFRAFYYYLSMTSYFGRVDVALPGCESYFMQMHEEEHEHALQCVNYIKMRGGLVKLCPIEPPDDQDWKSPLNAFKAALGIELDISDKLVSVNAVATKHGDLSASDFVVTNFIGDQMKSVNTMMKFVNLLTGIGDESLARFIFDKDLLEIHVLPEFNVLKKKQIDADCGTDLDTALQRLSTSQSSLQSDRNRRIDSKMFSLESTVLSDLAVKSDSRDSTENSYKTARTTSGAGNSSLTDVSAACQRSLEPDFINRAKNAKFEPWPELDLTPSLSKDSDSDTNKNMSKEGVSASKIVGSSSGINNCAPRHCDTPKPSGARNVLSRLDNASNPLCDRTIKTKENICKFIQDESMPEWAPSLCANSILHTSKYPEDNDWGNFQRTDTTVQSRGVPPLTRYKTLCHDAAANKIYRKMPLNILKSTFRKNQPLGSPGAHVSLDSTQDFEKLEKYIEGLPPSPANRARNIRRNVSNSDISVLSRDKLIHTNSKFQRANTTVVSPRALCSTEYKTQQHNAEANKIYHKTPVNIFKSSSRENRTLGSPGLHVSLGSTQDFEKLEKYIEGSPLSPVNRSRNLRRSVSTSDISVLLKDTLTINCTVDHTNAMVFDTFDSHRCWGARERQEPSSGGMDRGTVKEPSVNEQEINEGELSTSLLIEWKKKRQRCFDTAMKMQEIVLESKKANKDHSKVSDLYMDPSNEFIKTITTSSEYQDCLASVRQNINCKRMDVSSADSRIPFDKQSSDDESQLSGEHSASLRENLNNSPPALSDRKQSGRSVIDAPKFTLQSARSPGNNDLLPSTRVTPLMINHRKERIMKMANCQTENSPVSAKTAHSLRRKFFVTPGKPIQVNSNDKKRILFPNIDNEINKDLSRRVMKSLHAPGLYRLGYQTVISPVRMYIHGTDMNLIQNRHEKKNEMLLTPSKATTSEDKLKFKLSGKTSTPRGTPPKNSRFAFKEVADSQLDANDENIQEPDFALPKATYRFPAQVRTVNENPTYNRGARARGLLQSMQNRLVIRHEGKRFGKNDDNEVPDSSSDSSDMSIHVQKSAKKTNYMSHWK